MRKMELQQVENILRLLAEVHIQIKKAAEEGEQQNIQTLLADSQAGAEELGRFIEQAEGGKCKTVQLLEEYSETLYQIFEELNAQGHLDAAQTYKLLSDQLRKVEISLSQDIRIRKEVVFLPYKASMWDSLESVWRRMSAQPDCDAYVIPIPYFDKNPDGTFREMHYEGAEYPEDVPVLSYEEYDFAQRKPDAIYIHNPYDAANYVTSVHPFFYSENLKQFTDQLVYIPYFVLNEPNPDNSAELEGMSHFVVVPAIVHADKVIVQSENMRQAYINIMCKNTSEAARGYWETKISGEGSPKFEKLANTSLDAVKIPEDWKKLIYRPDGTKKKVIMYNTTVSALLENNDEYLNKMRRVFEVFKENLDSVALLWRPHPLIQATISSMRPQLWEEYQKLKEEYCSENWGIYDDSAELDRAIVLSDAYYGDASSVVQLCQKAGMPIMLQNVWV